MYHVEARCISRIARGADAGESAKLCRGGMGWRLLSLAVLPQVLSQLLPEALRLRRVWRLQLRRLWRVWRLRLWRVRRLWRLRGLALWRLRRLRLWWWLRQMGLRPLRRLL